MWVPFITKLSGRKLERRKGISGGGGSGSGGGGSAGAGDGDGSGSSSSSGSSGSHGSSGGGGGGGGGGGPPDIPTNLTAPMTPPINTGQGVKNANKFSDGGGPISTIPSGLLFAGRSIGGGTRKEVYGTRTYGSGYPGNPNDRGVSSRGFPFYFWPLAWGGGETGTAAYLSDDEYGRFDNSSRPGGIMVTATFSSPLSNTTYRLVADNVTVTDLIPNVVNSCREKDLYSYSVKADSFNDSLAAPRPEQVIQYYRASSAALTLDTYNNTGAFGQAGTPDTPLPENYDDFLLYCINNTIGSAILLVDAGNSMALATPSTMGLVVLAYLVWFVSSLA